MLQRAVHGDRYFEQRRNCGEIFCRQAADANKVAQRINDGFALIALGCTQHMGAMPDYQIGAGVYHGAGKSHGIAAIFPHELLVCVFMPDGGRAFCAGMKGDDDVGTAGFGLAYPFGSLFQFKYRIESAGVSETQHCNIQAAY
jgi:hypothetical protein